jgi:hypothetical protein
LIHASILVFSNLILICVLLRLKKKKKKKIYSLHNANHGKDVTSIILGLSQLITVYRQAYFSQTHSFTYRFYRCVKFNQYSADFTVFEYDCPAGLAFDERWEVCVWPGSLPERACQGSSEIAPVPRARYACPAAEGYYADPENCRWFFACLDHARDGITPLTAYEFRCPFGLVFDEQNLLCQWPWLVDGCGNSGTFAGAYFGAVAFGDAARRGYVATARTEYGAGDVAGSVLVTASDSGVHSGVGIASGGSTTVIQHGAGHDVGRVPLKHTNFHSNAVTSSSYIAGASRGSVKYSSTSTLGGGFDGQIASSYIAGGRSGASFGNADSYNEGRHISSYASLPDSYISGGRIENSGGLVLGEHVGIHAIGTGFGIRSGGSSVISGGKAAGITTASDNAALNENSYGARTLFSSGTAHGNEGGQFSGGVLSSVPIQSVVETQNSPVLPVVTLKKPAVTQIPIVQPTIVPATAYQQTVVETAQAPVVPVTTFRRPVTQKVPVVQPAAVPVAQAVPVTTYQETVVGTPQVPVVSVTTFRRPAIQKVPLVQPAAVSVAQAVPVTTYQQTVVETPQAPDVPITTFRRPTIEKVPVVQPAAVPVAQAVPATAYQQTVVETPQAPVVPVTTFRRPAIEKVPVVQPAAVPVAQAVPATAYQQAVVESPQAPVVPITTFKRPAIEKVPVVQPAAVPVAQAVPVTAYQQTVVESPQAPVVPVTTFRRPAIEKLPVAQTVPVTTYRQKVAEISTRTKLRPVSPQVPAVHVTKPVAPVVNTYLSTPAPAVVAIQSEFSEAHGAGFVTGGDAGVGNSFQGRPAVSVATNGAAGISVPLVRPNVETSGVVVTTNAVPLTSVPVIETGVSSGGYSYSTPATTIDTSGSISVTSIPSYSPSGYVSSTSAPAIFSGSSIPETPVIKSGTATADYSYSTPATAIFTGKSVSVTPVSALKLHTSSGSYSFTTPASTIKFNVPTAGHSYPAPAPTTVTSGAASINVASPVRTNVESHTVPSSGIVSGDTAVLVNTRISPTVGYSQPKSSTAFITGKAASFRGVSLASGLEPAVFDSSAGIASGLEIPSSTPGSTFVASGVTRRPYTTRVGATTLVVPPTSNIKISNIQENGYVPSSVTVTPDISIPKGYTLNRKALLSSTAAPIHSVSFVDGDFGARTSYQNGESVAPYPGAVAKEEFIPQINLTYGAHPAKVYTTGSAFITSSISGTGRTQGQGSTYSDHVSGYVSSAPIPLTSTSGSSVIYSSSPRPTAFQVPSSAPYTLKPVTYTVDVTSKSAETVSTSAPVTTAAYLSPAPVLQSVPSNYENLEGFGSRISQSASGRKSTSKTRINYDNENVEALLDKYSGKFGGLLDNNKEGFISGVINDDLVGHSRGRVSQRGRGDVFQRERVDNVRLSGIYGGYSTTAGYSDEGSSTVFGTRAGFADTPATASPSMGELRGKVRYSANTNTDADGGIGYDTVAVEHKGTKLQSKEAPVVVITRLSDINPLLIAKLGAQCTCKSNTVTLKRPVGYTRDGSASKSASISSNIFDDDIISRSGTYSIPEHIPLAPLPGSNLVTGSSPDIILGLGDEISSTAPPGLAPVSLATPRTNEFFQAIGLEEVGVTPTVLVATSRVRNKSTGVTYAAAKPVEISSPVPFSNGVRLRARPQVVSTPLLPLAEVRTPTPSTTDVRAHKRPLTPVVVSTTAVPVTVTEVPDFKRVAAVSGGYPEAGLPGSGVAVSESARGLDVGTDGSVSGAGLHSTAQVGIGAGRAFDRYGPGGWRGLDETLQGSVDCQRAGLFRHPKYCNKFYACYWDEWKRRYTLHVFNCPVHLAYDSSLGACNWPSKGPACSDDNLLV